jgi:hypothetical protein
LGDCSLVDGVGQIIECLPSSIESAQQFPSERDKAAQLRRSIAAHARQDIVHRERKIHEQSNCVCGVCESVCVSVICVCVCTLVIASNPT